MPENANKTFSNIREVIWPIHSYELKKVVPLLLIKLFVTLTYTILKDAKDTLIVTSVGSGAEAIPVLKGWVVLPLAFLAMITYSKLSNILSRTTLFYTTILSFMAFFFFYGFILYPMRDVLCPHQSADWLISVLGEEREHWVAVYRYWMNSLFFVAAELWGGMAIGLLFWGFANQVCRVDEAKRFYAIYSAAGDIGLIMAGRITWYFASSFSDMNFEYTLKYLIGSVLICGLAIISAYWWFNRYVMPDAPVENAKVKKSKPKLSLRESLSYLASSPYLLSIAVMVIAYGLAFNLVEVTWKASLKLQYPNPNDYQSFMGTISTILGFFSLITTLFVGGFVTRKFGWLFSARVTPILVGITAMGFLCIYLSKDALTGTLALLGTTPIMLVVIIGAMQNILGKTLKYSFFDPTKEMAFIPLDEECKVKGKAAIDVVASRFGKSGSSWIQVILIEFVGGGSVLGIAHWLAPFIIFTIAMWLYAVNTVGKEFAILSGEENTSTPKKKLVPKEA